MATKPGSADQHETLSEDFPPAPTTIGESGLGINFLLPLTLKTMYVIGLETAAQVRHEMKLSGTIVRDLLKDAGDKGLLEILGQVGEGAIAQLRYALTAKGREWATEALGQSQYIGPAPVNLADFHVQIKRQQLTNERVGFQKLEACFDGLVLPEGFVSQIGPAIKSGRSLLLYGPPGNGKTSIAQALGKAFEQTIYVPYCIEVDGQIIKIFDTTVHDPVAEPTAAPSSIRDTQSALHAVVDKRWLRCQRPLVTTGGELNLDMLDLNFNPHAKYYEAPMQLKATNGIFIIDDFGRQLVSPEEVLNRWIIPLERRMDYLTLHTGKKFPVPFDEFVIFSTNLMPKQLMDAATSRRIQYKIEISGPTLENYTQIFEEVCAEYDLELPADLIPFLLSDFYDEDKDIPLARHHPRWIVEQVVSRCDYEGSARRLDRQLVLDALGNLYTKY